MPSSRLAAAPEGVEFHLRLMDKQAEAFGGSDQPAASGRHLDVLITSEVDVAFGDQRNIGLAADDESRRGANGDDRLSASRFAFAVSPGVNGRPYRKARPMAILARTMRGGAWMLAHRAAIVQTASRRPLQAGFFQQAEGHRVNFSVHSGGNDTDH